MTYKVTELVLRDRGVLFMVSPTDCIKVDIDRFNAEPVVSVKTHEQDFADLSDAWHYIGRLLKESKATYAFIPNKETCLAEINPAKESYDV